jgi:cob(I)alamin adenosyltransferase
MASNGTNKLWPNTSCEDDGRLLEKALISAETALVHRRLRDSCARPTRDGGVGEDYVAALDAALAQFNAPLPALREFILPGGSPAAAAAHVARTVCRRAERALIALTHEEAVSTPTRQYLNRLSDLLFVLARVLNRAAGVEDPYWKPHAAPGET